MLLSLPQARSKKRQTLTHPSNYVPVETSFSLKQGRMGFRIVRKPEAIPTLSSSSPFLLALCFWHRSFWTPRRE
jgi:hypothetical protein